MRLRVPMNLRITAHLKEELLLQIGPDGTLMLHLSGEDVAVTDCDHHWAGKTND